jgi:hypothetical protein
MKEIFQRAAVLLGAEGMERLSEKSVNCTIVVHFL